MKKTILTTALLGLALSVGMSAYAITVDEAKTIALNHAGLTAQDIRNLHTETDFDNGIGIYEIEFRAGNMKYEYEIRQDNGQIVEFSYKSR